MNSGAITSAIVLSGLIRVRERARARRRRPPRVALHHSERHVHRRVVKRLRVRPEGVESHDAVGGDALLHPEPSAPNRRSDTTSRAYQNVRANYPSELEAGSGLL